MVARVESLVECTFRLDGGAMFGVVPKPLWERHLAADQRNRIELVCRILVVEGDGYLAVVDAGMGDLLSEKERELYCLPSQHCALDEGLAGMGLAAGDVTDVVLTHLHFDHAGGLQCAGGSLRFPRATHHLQKRHWDYATHPAEKDAPSYRRATLEALSGAQLRLLDGPGEVLPGMHCAPTNGHTEALQVVTVDSDAGPIVFAADLVPTSAHVHVPWMMAYDNQPLLLLEEKRALLGRAMEMGATVIFEHDAAVPAARIRFEDGRYRAVPV